MRSKDVRHSLTDHFEPATFAAGPDGAIAPPVKLPVLQPLSLCEQGPCVNYHRFALPFEAERAMGASIEPGGKIVGDPGPHPRYVETHHYCYPTPGVEMDLGGMAVLSCNRWDPAVTADLEREKRRAEFRASLAGETYARELEQWETCEEKELPSEPITHVIVRYYGAGEKDEERVPATGATTIAQLIGCVPDGAGIYDSSGAELTNLSATLSSIGATDGEVFTFKRKES